MIKHTTTPWHVSSDPTEIAKGANWLAQCSCNAFNGRTDDRSERDKANAAFIVKAVNSHYALVEAVQALLVENEHGANILSATDKAMRALRLTKETPNEHS